MLRRLHRALVLSNAASAAKHTVTMLSDRELEDLGYSRLGFEKAIVDETRKALDKQDKEAEARKLANNYHKKFGTKPVAANVNPNLVGAV